MIDYREILRLNSLGTSQRGIAREVQSSRDTVARVLAVAKAAGVSWPLGEDVTNEMIQDGTVNSFAQISSCPSCTNWRAGASIVRTNISRVNYSG